MSERAERAVVGSDRRGERGSIQSQGRREPRWPASLAVLAALVLYLTLPAKLTIGPGWVIPVLEGALVVALTVTAPYRNREEVRLIRFASLLLIELVTLANVVSLALLVHVVLSGGLVSGRTLIFSGIQIWLTLILVFALWYWELDRGGPQSVATRMSEPQTSCSLRWPHTSSAKRTGCRCSWTTYTCRSRTRPPSARPTRCR